MKRHLLITLLLFIFNNSFAQNRVRGEIYQLGNSPIYVAAITRDHFEFFEARQQFDNWCWAACTQMVLNYQGVSVNQEQIVVKAFGRLINTGADCSTIVNAASGWNLNGTRIRAFSVDSRSPGSMIDALANKYPIIIGLNMPNQSIGHAYVLTAVYFNYDSTGQKIPFKVTLRDPWPTNNETVELDWNDFSHRINCIVHVTY